MKGEAGTFVGSGFFHLFNASMWVDNTEEMSANRLWKTSECVKTIKWPSTRESSISSFPSFLGYTHCAWSYPHFVFRLQTLLMSWLSFNFFSCWHRAVSPLLNLIGDVSGVVFGLLGMQRGLYRCLSVQGWLSYYVICSSSLLTCDLTGFKNGTKLNTYLLVPFSTLSTQKEKFLCFLKLLLLEANEGRTLTSLHARCLSNRSLNTLPL